MKIKYEDIKFYGRALTMIAQANEIIEDYAKQGYSLTLRQLYYQFVSRNYIPNTDKEYKRLGNVISNGRRAGLIDWDAIVDRTRFLRSTPSWHNPAEILESCASQFQVNPWDRQPYYVELWFEKDALLGVFERAAQKYRLPFFSCRGYTSDSEIWGAAQRLARKSREGKQIEILHFGDHDPSGLDMTRDITERLALFDGGAVVNRLALNMDQVKKYNPPPNPAKESDSRFDKYMEEFGEYSWELDALEPTVLVDLVNKQVAEYVKKHAWTNSMKLEAEYKGQLRKCAEQWDGVVQWLDTNEES